MSEKISSAPITALLYSEGADIDLTMRTIADHLAQGGVALAGVVQKNDMPVGRCRCDMSLVELASGMVIAISQDRGPEARGCRLDASELMRAVALTEEGLAGGPDLLIVNRFGKTEAAGGGFRTVIAAAIEQGVPVLVGVPWRNLDMWRAFAGDLTTSVQLADLPSDPARLCNRLGLDATSNGTSGRSRRTGITA